MMLCDMFNLPGIVPYNRRCAGRKDKEHQRLTTIVGKSTSKIQRRDINQA
jgi:hypothetical protein